MRNGDLPSSPRWRISVGPRYEASLGAVDLIAQFDVNFQSDQQFAIEQDPKLVQDAYTLVDASIGLRTADKRIGVTLFVKNLFDTNYYTTLGGAGILATPTSADDLSATFNKDSKRYFGATLNLKI